MSVIVITDGEKITVTRGTRWTTGPAALDVTDDQGSVIASFRRWESAFIPREDATDDAPAVRVEVSAHRVDQLARTRPQSKDDMVRRVVGEVTEVAREQVWAYLLKQDES